MASPGSRQRFTSRVLAGLRAVAGGMAHRLARCVRPALPPSPGPEPAGAQPTPKPAPEGTEATSETQQAYSAWWRLLTLIALILFCYFLLALWYRWVPPDPGFLAFSVGIAQLVALVSLLGLQTDWGRQLAGRLAQTVKLQGWLGNPRRACLSAWLAAAGLALLFSGSVLAADLFNARGAAALEAGRYSTASRAFGQAVSLSPRNARAHYNLGNAYEALHDLDQAIAEYQVALELDDQLVPAYNNLGRLYLRARGDADAALVTLLAGLGQVEDPLGRAVLHKNIGQAYLEKGLPTAALDALAEARTAMDALAVDGINVSIYLAETQRLAALAHESLAQSAEAQRAWATSQGHALAVLDSEACAHPFGPTATDCLNAQVWAAEAQAHLGGGE